MACWTKWSNNMRTSGPAGRNRTCSTITSSPGSSRSDKLNRNKQDHVFCGPLSTSSNFQEFDATTIRVSGPQASEAHNGATQQGCNLFGVSTAHLLNGIWE